MKNSESGSSYTIDLRSLFSKTIEGDRPIMVECPYHKDSHPSMAVYSSNCYCFSCRKWESFWEVMERMGHPVPEGEVEIREASPPPLIKEETLREMAIRYHETLFLMNKQSYFLGRGLSFPTIKEWKLGYTGIAFSIPIWDSGILRTIRFRRDDAIRTDGSKYWGIKGTNSTFLYAPLGVDKQTILCEGEFEVLIATQCGAVAVSLTNGIGGNVALFEPRWEGVERILIAVDQDKASYARSLQLKSWFNDKGISASILRWREKDLTDFYLAHGEEKTKELLGVG